MASSDGPATLAAPDQPRVVLIQAHPDLAGSSVNRALLEAAREVPGLAVRELYRLYPDFSIDVAREQALLALVDTVVVQHPLYWYSVPPLLKLWFDDVLRHGWAYGEGGRALLGKRFLWVVSTGGDASDYHPQGTHARAFEHYTWPMLQLARYCGMHWLPPVVVEGAHRQSSGQMLAIAAGYRARLAGLVAGEEQT